MPRKRTPGQRTVRNIDLAGVTAAAANVWAPPVGAALEELLRPYLAEGEAMPDAVLLQKLVGRLLADREKQLDTVALKAQDHRTIAAGWRIRRDAAAKSLRGELRRARFYFDEARGKGEGAHQGLGKGLSYMAPSHLARTGQQAAAALDELEATLPRNETLPSPAGLAQAIREKAAVLEAALKKLEPRRQDAEISRVKRTQEHAKIEKTIRRSAGFLAGLYRLCEFEDFAKKVRPVFRRKRRRRPLREEDIVPLTGQRPKGSSAREE